MNVQLEDIPANEPDILKWYLEGQDKYTLSKLESLYQNEVKRKSNVENYQVILSAIESAIAK